MTGLRPDDAVAQEVMQAIKHGSPEELHALLEAAPRARGGEPRRRVARGMGRAHAAAWRHRLAGARSGRGPAKVAALAAAGADVDAAIRQAAHRREAVHWAASADDRRRVSTRSSDRRRGHRCAGAQ